MALYPVNQKKVNMKQKNQPSVSKKSQPQMKVNPISFPTSDGDLGVLKIKSQEIPRQTQYPSSVGDKSTNHIATRDQKIFKKIMKHQGMIS
jgi:hypothetical protein